MTESVTHSNWVQVEKFSPEQVQWVQRKGILSPKGYDFARLKIKADEIVIDETPNLVTTIGLGRLTNFLIGTASLVGFTSTTTRIGVGDSSTAATAADTDLGASAGSTHRWFQVVDSAPTRTTTTVTNDTISCVATFASADGNFAWAEWCNNLGTATVASSNAVDASAGACFFNHKIASLGTKVSGAAWTLTTKITFS